MKDCLIDGMLDTLKLLPYLLITFVVLELIEHKFSNKSQKILSKNKKYGPVIGGILGALPQCGFSAMASNLFSARVITMGTLVAIFLSTSDEMLPIMLSEQADIMILVRIIAFKIIVGIVIGFIIDLIYRKKQESKKIKIKDVCEHEHCNCGKHGVIISSLIHTLKIGLFVLAIEI